MAIIFLIHGMSDFNTQKTKDTTTTWLTPPWMLDMLGPFDLDPCAAVGRPIGWTDCERLAMDRFRWWLRSHLRFLRGI